MTEQRKEFPRKICGRIRLGMPDGRGGWYYLCNHPSRSAK